MFNMDLCSSIMALIYQIRSHRSYTAAMFVTQMARLNDLTAISGPRFLIHTRVSFRQYLPPEKGRFAVKRKRFSVEQVVGVLKQAEAGGRWRSWSDRCESL